MSAFVNKSRNAYSGPDCGPSRIRGLREESARGKSAKGGASPGMPPGLPPSPSGWPAYWNEYCNLYSMENDTLARSRSTRRNPLPRTTGGFGMGGKSRMTPVVVPRKEAPVPGFLPVAGDRLPSNGKMAKARKAFSPLKWTGVPGAPPGLSQASRGEVSRKGRIFPTFPPRTARPILHGRRST